MAGKIIIDSERCKGCGLCIIVCPKSGIAVSKQSNKKGFFPAEAKNSDCTGCALCAIVCADCAIVVYRDEDTSEATKKSKRSSIKGKT